MCLAWGLGLRDYRLGLGVFRVLGLHRLGLKIAGMLEDKGGGDMSFSLASRVVTPIMLHHITPFKEFRLWLT